MYMKKCGRNGDNPDLNKSRQFIIKGNNVTQMYKHIPIATKNSIVTTHKNNSDLSGKMKNIKDIRKKCANETITSNKYQEIMQASTSAQSNNKINMNTKTNDLKQMKNYIIQSNPEIKFTQSQEIIALKRADMAPFDNSLYNMIHSSERENDHEADVLCQPVSNFTNITNDDDVLGEYIYYNVNDENEQTQDDTSNLNEVSENNKSCDTDRNMQYNDDDKMSLTQTSEKNYTFDDIIKNQIEIIQKLDFLMEFITNESKGEVGSFNKAIIKKTVKCDTIKCEYKFVQKSELDKFDRRLKTDQEFLHSFTLMLLRFCGKCVKSSIRKMLESVISYELSVHFSYYGQKNNIKIKDYKFITVILDIAIEKFQCPLEEAEKVIKDFFRRAGTKINKKKLTETKENRQDASNVNEESNENEDKSD